MQKPFIILQIIIILFFSINNIKSQEVIISNNNVTDCEFTLYDTGGVNASGYSENQDFTTTICPDQANKAIVITWFTFTLGAGDYMEIYDGNSTSAPLLGTYINNELNNITAYASITNTSGCLTLHFVSDNADNGVFNASVKCEKPCAYPTAGISSPTQGLMQVCKGTTINFDGSASAPKTGFSLTQYNWDFGDETLENNTNPTTSHTFNETGRYIVSLTVEDDNNCINKNAAFVEVIVETDPIFSMESVEVCEGEIFCIPAGVTSPPLPEPENDMFGQGIHIPDDVGSCFQATQFFDVFPVGSRLSNISDLQNIYANMGHTFIGDLIISIICPSGQSVILHQQGGGGADLNGDYYWDPTTTNPTWAGSGAGAVLPPGTYSSVQSLNGLIGCELNGTWTLQICDMWASDQGDVFGWGVNINPNLYVDLEALSPTIGNNIDSSVISGTGVVSLSPDGNTMCAQQNTAGNYDYTYTVTNSFGCTHDTTVTATVKPGPIVDFDFDSICIETQANFINQTTGTLGQFNFTWDFGDGSPVVNTLNAQHFYTNVGTYNVSLIADAGNGCIDDSIKVIEVYAEPIANFNVLDDCINNQPTFTDASSVNSGIITNWQWNFGETLPNSIIESTIQNPNYNYLNSGSYDVTLIVETDKGCNDTIVKTTNRHPKPIANFNVNSQCEYDSLIFQNISTINNPDQISNLIWNFGDGSSLNSDSNPKHLYNQDGEYTVSLIATSNNGCVHDTSFSVIVYPKPTANFSSTTECENFNPTSFTNMSNVVSGSIVDWEWSFNDSIGGVSSIPSPIYNYQKNGSYNVNLIVKTDFGCLDTIEKIVEVLPKPENEFLATITENCSPFCVTFNEQTIPNSSSIVYTHWQIEGHQDNYSSTTTACYKNTSHINEETFDVTLITKNDLGCYDTLTKTDYITVWPNPLADFVPNPKETNMYETEIGFENNSEGASYYNWNFGDSSTSSEFEPYNIYKDTGSYNVELLVLNQYGCRDSIIDIVKIIPVLNVYIPNTFTPNGDGDNDYFFIKGYSISEENFEFMIFDRWGTLMYFTDKFIPWDGTYKGEPVQQDVYTYLVRLKDDLGKEHTYKGHINLIR